MVGQIAECKGEEGKGRVRTWYKMKSLLKQEFLPPDYEQILFQQYQRCQQGNRSIHVYTVDFMRLAERNNLSETEGQQVARHLDGLKPFIRDRIGVQTLRTLSEAKNMAMKAELMQQERSRKGFDNFRAANSLEKSRAAPEVPGRNDRYSGSNNNRYNAERSQDDKTVGKRPMNEAKEKGAQVQKGANTNPYTRPITGKCFRCNQPGHRSNECPQRKTVNVATREEEEDEYCCEPDGEDGDYEDEEGEEAVYVVREDDVSSEAGGTILTPSIVSD